MDITEDSMVYMDDSRERAPTVDEVFRGDYEQLTKFNVDDIVRQFITDVDQLNNTSKIFTTTNLGNN